MSQRNEIQLGVHSAYLATPRRPEISVESSLLNLRKSQRVEQTEKEKERGKSRWVIAGPEKAGSSVEDDGEQRGMGSHETEGETKTTGVE